VNQLAMMKNYLGVKTLINDSQSFFCLFVVHWVEINFVQFAWGWIKDAAWSSFVADIWKSPDNKYYNNIDAFWIIITIISNNNTIHIDLITTFNKKNIFSYQWQKLLTFLSFSWHCLILPLIWYYVYQGCWSSKVYVGS